MTQNHPTQHHAHQPAPHHAQQHAPQQHAPVTVHPHLPKPSGWRRLRNGLSTFGIILLAPIIAILLTTFFFQTYQVDGPSMESTLQNNDRLIISKLPRTWSSITGTPYVPDRGDVIVFNKPDVGDFNGDTGSKQLIKRVVGLPGERVVVRNNLLTIYNRQNPDGFNPDRTLPYGSAVKSTPGNIDVTVPEDEIFVCGDNRPNSLDSRVFGTVPVDNIVGKLRYRILPLSEARRF